MVSALTIDTCVTAQIIPVEIGNEYSVPIHKKKNGKVIDTK